MESGSTFRDWQSDEWRMNHPTQPPPEALKELPESVVPDELMPRLLPNDVWMYQRRLEHFIEISAPGMGTQYHQMLRALCARARICYQLEHESGHFIGEI